MTEPETAFPALLAALTLSLAAVAVAAWVWVWREIHDLKATRWRP